MANGEAYPLAMPVPVIWGEAVVTSEAEDVGFRRWTLIWVTTALALFPVLVALGWLMRLSQANWLVLRPEWFYAFMTLHGLGMVGVWYISGMAGTGYLMTRYVRPSLAVNRTVFLATVLAVLLLVAATLGGKFLTGWYFLYPLPFFSGGVWKPWATVTFFAFLTIAGVAWTVWTLDLVRAIARRYPIAQALAWDVLFGRRAESDVPPSILIATVSLVSALVGFLAGVVVLVLFFIEGLGTGFTNDALLMKNLTFYFGHVLVNITMYLGVLMVYELMPRYAEKGKFKLNRVVAAAWNAVLLLVNLAYFHHLYMDFVQPGWFQRVGQVASYFVSVPAAVVTIFSTLALVYGSRMRWTLPATLFYLGVMGWAIGGVAAVVDSTIAVNFRFHNTLWVPAHFHTYYLMGVVLMILGFAFQFVEELSKIPEHPTLAKVISTLLVVGGYGFLAMFYYAGAHSVPRRYSIYPEEVAQGVGMARVAIGFIAVLTLGILLYLWEFARRWPRAWAALRSSPGA